MPPKMFDNSINRQAGIPTNPKYGNDLDELKKKSRHVIRLIDMQNAINRFTWYNLPNDLDGQLLERILYYKGQAMFYYNYIEDKFYFLPFAVSGKIDVYGRYGQVTPLPFRGLLKSEKDNNPLQADKRKPLFDTADFDTLEEYEKAQNEYCVILKDYSSQESENVIPRFMVNEELIELESDMLPLMRTALFNSTGVNGIRIENESESSNVAIANEGYRLASLRGEQWVPIVGVMEMQELTGGNVTSVNEFMLAMQSVDNIRLSTYGLSNGGMFEKQGTILQSEADMAGANTGLILEDSLRERQRFCDKVNSLFGLSIWCEITQPQTPLIEDENSQTLGEDTQGQESEAVENAE